LEGEPEDEAEFVLEEEFKEEQEEELEVEEEEEEDESDREEEEDKDQEQEEWSLINWSVINHGLTMREAGQRVQPNLSRFTVAGIIQTFRNDNRYVTIYCNLDVLMYT